MCKYVQVVIYQYYSISVWSLWVKQDVPGTKSQAKVDRHDTLSIDGRPTTTRIWG